MKTAGTYSGQRFKVLKGYHGNDLSGTINSHTRNPNGETITIAAGEAIYFDCEAANGNVWFETRDGKRFKTESGSVKNMMNAGVIEQLDPMEDYWESRNQKHKF